MLSPVLALCKLHNFCKSNNIDMIQTAEKNVTNIVNHGGLFLPKVNNQSALRANDKVQDGLAGLLDGGHHIHDDDDDAT